MNRQERGGSNLLTREALVSLARTFTPGDYKMAGGRYVSVASHSNMLGSGWVWVGILKPIALNNLFSGYFSKDDVVKFSTSRLYDRRATRTERYIFTRGKKIQFC